ncbi:FliG C-terminal domain-containing protein [Paramagnetospirillum marisnigri]|nr:FliG C-terminal domain-containing protein [Paramagnetospirillum marisnigri]
MDDIDKARATIPPISGSLHDAVAVWDRGDYEAAVRRLRPLAVHGDRNAQFMLGNAYEHGDGVPQDADAAMRWYCLAAEQGMAAAQRNVGLLHENGTVGERDYAEALRWFQMAGDQGDADALCQIGVLHSCGLAVERDYVEALRLLCMAADKGLAEAQFRIGAHYFSGHGVEQDYGEAMRWYRLASDQGLWAAQLNIASMYLHGHGVKTDFVEAKRWFDLAEGGRMVAVMDIAANDAPPFDDPAEKVWKRLLADAPPASQPGTESAAKDGDADSALAHGLSLYQSLDFQARCKGSWWIERAAELGLTKAQVLMADLLGSGSSLAAWELYGIHTDEKAAAWWRAAAEASAAPPAWRKQIERGWPVVGPVKTSEPLSVIPPLSDLRFEDIVKLGSEAMLILLRYIDMDDCAWALAPVHSDERFRERHFFLNHMPKPVARSVMRVMLTADTMNESGKCWDAQGRIIGTLTELVEEGEITLPDVLVAELTARDRGTAECPLFSFGDREAEFNAAYRRLARRSGRGAPMAPPDPLGTFCRPRGPRMPEGSQDDHLGTSGNLFILTV